MRAFFKRDAPVTRPHPNPLPHAGEGAKRGGTAMAGARLVIGKPEGTHMSEHHDDPKWSAEVTEHSDALDLERDVFKSNDPK